MSKTALLIYDLNPDGVRIAVDWDAFRVGTSIFVPCLNMTVAKRQIKRITADKGMEVNIVPRVEDGMWGLRVWREK